MKDLNTHSRAARKFIEDTISHPEYLHRLEEAGFALCILFPEGIWCTSIRSHDGPDAKLLEVLIPPC